MGNGPGTKNKGEIRKIKSHYFLSFLSFHNQDVFDFYNSISKKQFSIFRITTKTILRKKTSWGTHGSYLAI